MQTAFLQSAWLSRWAKQLETGDQQTLDSFWEETKHRGTPLIEPIEDDDANSLVTYLYRQEPEENVQEVLIYATFPSWNWKQESQLDLLPGTDVWYKTCKCPNDVISLYYFWVNDNPDEDFRTRFEKGKRDPLNPHLNIWPADEKNERSEMVGSMLEMPNSLPRTWAVEQEIVSKGHVHLLRFQELGADTSRRVYVYTPPGYVADAEPYPLAVFFDGWCYVNMVPTPVILDNLIAAGEVPPLIAVFIDQRDRMVELMCDDSFLKMVSEELLPWVRTQYNATDDPSRVLAGGSSLGGLTSMYWAFKRPDVVRNVFTQTGSFWYDPNGEKNTNWLGRKILAAERLPLHIYFELGTLEGPIMQSCNREMRDTLLAHGYPVDYREYGGGHEYAFWRATLAQGLISLAGPWKS